MAYHVIFSFGQSNGEPVGQGPHDDPLARQSIDRNILQLGRYRGDNMKVIPLRGRHKNDDGLQNYRKVMGHAAITSFARWYVRSDLLDQGDKVVLVCGNFYGTSILHWMDELEKENPAMPDSLFDDLVARLQWLQEKPGTKIVAGLLALGERDCANVQHEAAGRPAGHGMTVNVFKTKLATLISNLRTAVPQDPPYPILGHQLMPNWDFGSTEIKEQINAGITEVLQADLLGDTISVAGLISNYESKENNSRVHYDAASMTKMARRMWAKRLELQ